MSSTPRPNEISVLFGGTMPPDTRGVLIERLIPSPGRRGGRRERVAYVLPEACSPWLRGLAHGRYRISCVGARGCIKDGARVVEARGDGALPQVVPPRSPRDYPRTARARKRSRLRARLKTARARLHATTRAKRGAGRKVRRRDAQILRERADHARRETQLRAEVRAARRSARAATRARDGAYQYAGAQERARAEAERRAFAEAQARAAADAEVVRLRAELRALKKVEPHTSSRPAPPRRPRAAEATSAAAAPRATAEAPPPRQTPPPPAMRPEAPARPPEPSPEEVHLRAHVSKLAAECAAMQRSTARLEDLLRRAIAARDAAQAVAAQRGVLLAGLTWCAGGAAVLAIALHASDALRRVGSGVHADTVAAARRPTVDGGTGAASGSGAIVPWSAASLVRGQWTGPPIVLSAGANGTSGPAPS